MINNLVHSLSYPVLLHKELSFGSPVSRKPDKHDVTDAVLSAHSTIHLSLAN